MQFLVLTMLLVFLCAAASSAQSTGKGQERTIHLPTAKIYAQKVVNETLAVHPEIMGLEISATSLKKNECTTIASDEELGIGEKCDQDEYTAMKTGKPFADKTTEHGQEFLDVNVPIHDANGKVVVIVGVDFKPFKPDPKQTAAQATEGAQQIAKEIEAKVSSREKLYEPVS
jgi:iron complex outermembrane receptor protein